MEQPFAPTIGDTRLSVKRLTYILLRYKRSIRACFERMGMEAMTCENEETKASLPTETGNERECGVAA